MLKTDKQVRVGSLSTLTEWASLALGLPDVRVQLRLRGNTLHILCEGSHCPDVAIAVPRFAKWLKETNLESSLSPDQPKIYQVFVYARSLAAIAQRGHQTRPEWCVRLDLNQLDRHLDDFQEVAPSNPEPTAPTLESHPPHPVTSPPKSQPPLQNGKPNPPKIAKSPEIGSQILQTNEQLARREHPDAIARYLSEQLNALGVAVKVTIRKPKTTAAHSAKSPGSPELSESSHPETVPKRLWVLCESAYSPDPSLLAEPIGARLRELHLKGFRDAVLVGQVSGEPKPEWILRVDLTPPDEMLKHWARWGDVAAIVQLLNQTLVDQGLRVSGVLKESTLHLFCNTRSPQSPLQATVREAITPVLESLAPQGIHAATLYGQVAEDSPPAWVDWLDLPAAHHSALTPSALTLAEQGDREAITFLLDRLLNPDLERKLATGGIRIQMLNKGDLLHIMTEAPVCPLQSAVVPAVAKFMRQLHIPDVAGVRVYGRIAGQKSPLWHYAIDFNQRRQPAVAEPTPEFAVSESYGDEKLAPAGQLVLRPELEELPERSLLEELTQGLIQGLQRSLIATGVFIPAQEDGSGNAHIITPQRHAGKVALVWGCLGLILCVHADWMMGKWLMSYVPKVAPAKSAPANNGMVSDRPAAPQAPSASPSLPPLSLRQANTDSERVFNASGFLSEEPVVSGSDNAPNAQGSTSAAAELNLNFPSFQSQQLDEQLVRYQNYLADVGLPDILIVGSSRALRGIDPTELSKELAKKGHPNLKIFNFGINGATAQVVDMLIRQILPLEQVPKMILWADGARAFNSGRLDVTYNAIAISEGFMQITAGTHPLHKGKAGGSFIDSLVGTKGNRVVWTANYQHLNDWLNQQFASLSASYLQRDRLKSLFSQDLISSLKRPVPQFFAPSDAGLNDESMLSDPATTSPAELSADTGTAAFEDNGFLPLSIQFNLTSYYQKHPKVSGSYDADYDSFVLSGMQNVALKNLLEFTQSHQISVVFVNLPLTAEYLDPVRRGYEQEFHQHMEQMATETASLFLWQDFSNLWPNQHNFFSDPSHLNRFGAVAVSKALAEQENIPWPKAGKP